MPSRLRRLRSLACVLVAAAAACSSHKSPPLHVVIARTATVIGDHDPHCFLRTSTPPDDTLGAHDVATLRLTIREHGQSNPGGSFVCDRAVNARETPTLQIPLRGESTFDIYGEAFTAGPNAQRVAAGALTGVPLTSKTLSDLRLVRAQQFGCVNQGLTRPRAFHSATLLPNGQVLILGGLTGTDEHGEAFLPGPAFAAADAEIYDPAHGTFTAVASDTGDAALPRAFHQAALLDTTPPYHILVVGGLTVATSTTPAMDAFTTVYPGTRLVPFDTSNSLMTVPLTTRAAPAQLITYDPATNSITRAAVPGITPAVFQGASGFGSASAPTGMVVAGGIDWKGMPLTMPAPRVTQVAVTRSAANMAPEMPARLGPLVSARMGPTVTPLSDNTALLWGGQISTADSAGEFLSGLAAAGTVQTAAVTLTGAPQTEFHTATLVDDDPTMVTNHTILVTGGFVTQNTNMGTAVQPPGAATAVRILTVTPTGAVTSAGPSSSAFDPDTTCTVATRYRPAGWEAAVKLPRGRVLVSGGAPAVPLGTAGACNDCENGTSVLCAIGQAALFSAPGTWAPTGALNVPRFGHTQTLMPDGNVLVVGGIGPSIDNVRVLADVELYNPRPATPQLSPDGSADLDDPALVDGVMRAPGAVAKPCNDL